jgi:hypothetical protein
MGVLLCHVLGLELNDQRNTAERRTCDDRALERDRSRTRMALETGADAEGSQSA